MTVSFDPKQEGETILLEFPFLGRLAVEEALTESGVTCTVFAGTDPAPEDVILGDSTIDGTSVYQQVTGGIAGVIYTLSCTVETSDLNILIEAGQLAVLSTNPYQS